MGLGAPSAGLANMKIKAYPTSTAFILRLILEPAALPEAQAVPGRRLQRPFSPSTPAESGSAGTISAGVDGRQPHHWHPPDETGLPAT
jgi:hypothetical protein